MNVFFLNKMVVIHGRIGENCKSILLVVASALNSIY